MLLWRLVIALCCVVAYNPREVKDWNKYDVEQWLKDRKISSDGIKLILASGNINDGEDLLWINDEKKTKSELIAGLKRTSDKEKLKQSLNELTESVIINDEDDDINEGREEMNIEDVISSLKEECRLPKTETQTKVCKCIKNQGMNRYQSDSRKEEEEKEEEYETNKSDSFEREEEEEEALSDESDAKLEVYYTVNDLIKTEDELRTMISFNVLNEELTGIFYLKWCAAENSKHFCSKQSFSFRKHKKHEMSTTILTGIAYNFEIYDVNEKYHWRLRDYMDSKPNEDINSMIIEIIAEIPPFKNPSINDLSEDIGNKREKLKWRHPKDKTHKLYVSSAALKSDKLMAEKIRSVLLDKYRANNVDVSQKMDANSFKGAGIDIHSNWSISSNSTLFIICAVVLCGGIMVGIQKKFPFKYHTAAMYTKLTTGMSTSKNGKNEEMSHNFESVSIQKQAKSELNNNNDTEAGYELSVNTANAPKNSAQEFIESVFKNLGTPSFITSKYIQNLKDDYISSIDQLREFDDGDWKRYGFKKNHIIEIKNRLQSQDDEDEDDDELTFDEDDDDEEDEDKNAKQSENNDSTTDFDDF